MKARRGDERTLDAPGAVRMFLFHGPDAAGSAALCTRLQAGLGPEVERIALSASAIKGDPARLVDEAAAFTLFGGKRLIVVDGGGDELIEAATAVLTAPAAGNPVAIIAGTLKRTSKLLALVEASPHGWSFASYLPEGRDAERLVADLGRAEGLSIDADIARRIAEFTGGHRALIASEVDKFALYLDAEPTRPASLEAGVLDALSAATEESDVSGIVDAVLDGDPQALDRELTRAAGAAEDMAVLRAIARRILLLAKAAGNAEGLARSVPLGDKAAALRQLGRWPAERLAVALGHVLEAERGIKAVGGGVTQAAIETLFLIARAAQRGR